MKKIGKEIRDSVRLALVLSAVVVSPAVDSILQAFPFPQSARSSGREAMERTI